MSKQSFNEYLQTIPSDVFNDRCFDIAFHNWPRVIERCGAELLEEFNNDAIDEFESEWERATRGDSDGTD